MEPSWKRADAQTGRLAENIVHFARSLRVAGIPVGPGAVMDALAAVEAAGVGTREDFYFGRPRCFGKTPRPPLKFSTGFSLFFPPGGASPKPPPHHAGRGPPRA